MQQAVCIQRKKRETSSAPETHHEIHISLGTATTSRRSAMKHVSRVSLYLLAYVDSGFVEIVLVQLNQ